MSAPSLGRRFSERNIRLLTTAALIIAVVDIGLIIATSNVPRLAWVIVECLGMLLSVGIILAQYLYISQTNQRAVGLDNTVRERTAVLAESLEAMHQANDERRQLLLRLMSTQEQERKRIAEVIHDDMLQSIAAGQLHAHSLRRKGIPEDLEAKFALLEKQLDSSADALRGLTHDLALQALDLGFAGAIVRCIADVAETSDLVITLRNNIKGEPERPLATTMYRNIREALINVSKHAPDCEVVVSLSNKDLYTVVIRDNGPGFTVEGDGVSPQGHMGLSSMRERVEALGGTMSVKSQPGAGTTVEFRLPRQVIGTGA